MPSIINVLPKGVQFMSCTGVQDEDNIVIPISELSMQYRQQEPINFDEYNNSSEVSTRWKEDAKEVGIDQTYCDSFAGKIIVRQRGILVQEYELGRNPKETKTIFDKIGAGNSFEGFNMLINSIYS